MKKIFSIISLFILSSFNCMSQVYTINWTNTSTPHTLHLNILLGYGNHIKQIDQFFSGDTLFVDFIFTDCSSPLGSYYFDSTVNIPSSLTQPQYNFMVRIALDSNTIVGNNCYIHPRWYDTLFQYFIPVGINDWAYHSGTNLKIWPNPIQGIGYIETTQGEMSKCIKIYNLQGQLLKTISVKTGIQKQEIDLRELNSGIYFIKTDDGMMKVLKE